MMPPVHVLRTVSVTTLLTLFVEKMTSHMTMPVKPIARKKNLIYFVHIYCSTVCNNRLNSINTEFDSEFSQPFAREYNVKISGLPNVAFK